MTALHTTLAEIIEDAIDSVHDLDVTHADYANAAVKAVIEALPGCVPDLVWIECSDGTLHDPHCRYELETDGRFWRVVKAVTGGTSYVCNASTLEAAKAAANRHNRAQFAAMLGIGGDV